MSGFILKIIAIICMTIDHTYKLMPNLIATLPDIKLLFLDGSISLIALISILGRIAFPIFAFCVAESCRYTRNLKKYLIRLLIFAVISELPFDFMFRGSFTFYSQNVMWTFFLGVLAVFLYEKLNTSKVLSLFAVFCCAFISFVGRTDYRGMGVILIFVIYMMQNKPAKLLSMTIVIILYYLYQVGLLNAIIGQNTALIISHTLNLTATLFSVPIIALYNGKKGPGMKYFFYIYYPVHIIVLGLIDKLWI